MSFILDALKKSESERQRQAGPALLEMRIIPPARGLPNWAMVSGVILLASVAVLGWLALRTGPAPASAPASASSAAAAKRSLAGTPQAGAAWTGAPQVGVVPAQPSGAGSAPAMTAAPAPSAPAADTSDAGQAGDNPADTEPAVAAEPGTSPAGASGAKLRNYSELNGTVPELRLDLHVYAPNPAERYAFINMHKVHEGDMTPEGAQVREITREGVVIEYRGSEFLLGRQ